MNEEPLAGNATEADNLFNALQTQMGKIFEEEGLLRINSFCAGKRQHICSISEQKST
jgi:hypothetical protein